MALLGFLIAAEQFEGQPVLAEFEVEFEGVGLGHCQPQFLGFCTDLAVVDREPRSQNDIVEAVQGRPAETVLLGKR